MKKEDKRKVVSSCGSPRSRSPNNLPTEKSNLNQIKAKQAIRERYGEVASNPVSFQEETLISKEDLEGLNLYSEEELTSIPKGAHLGVGSGNPVSLASIQPGETVVDLGAGAGIDCFLAAQKTKTGQVIGVDMTPEMIDKARVNAQKEGYKNVEFRLGEIEYLPIADNVADLVISNCVINLSVDKPQVFKEAYRVLKPGGRMLISDLVLLKKLPDTVQTLLGGDGCSSGAWLIEDYLAAIQDAGFENIEVIDKKPIPMIRKKKKAAQIEEGVELKPVMIVDGKKIDYDFSVEEIESVGEAMVSAYVKAIKPTF